MHTHDSLSVTFFTDAADPFCSGGRDGSTVVALGDRVLKIKSHSDHQVVVELPEGLVSGSSLLSVTSSGLSKQRSEPFSAAVFAAC